MTTVRPLEAARPSITLLAGIVLLGVVLSLARPVLIPVALAILLTFTLAPAVLALQRRGWPRLWAVLTVALTTLAVAGGVALAITLELTALGEDVLKNKDKVVAKLRAFQGGPGIFAQLLQLLEEQPSKKGVAIPVSVQNEKGSRFDELRETFWALTGVVGSIGLVIALTVAMLLKREDLRNRIIRLAGQGKLTSTTHAMDEATRRISRYLLLQLTVNAGFGLVFGLGMAVLGVPYSLLWGIMAFLIRFIPYIGTWLAAALPLVFTFAMSETWFQPVAVIVFAAVLGLAVNNGIEPLLISRTTGVSPVALVVAAAFWTWLWGPIGLVLSTPMIVCLGVLGRFVPSLEFLNVIFGNDPALDPQHGYYQRLLAHDETEAEEILTTYAQEHAPLEMADHVLLPALMRAKEDRNQGHVHEEDLNFIVNTTAELVEDIGVVPAPEGAATPPAAPLILGLPAKDRIDELALSFLQRWALPEHNVQVLGNQAMAADALAEVRQQQPAVVVIGAVHPGGLARVRYLIKRLRAAFPDVPIAVGYWGLPLENTKLPEQLQKLGVQRLAVTLARSAQDVQEMLRTGA